MRTNVGETNWFDLPVSDLLDAMSFYEGLLNWKFVQMNESKAMNYVMIRADDKLIGGLRQVKKETVRATDDSAIILYFTVPELTAAMNRAKELGATLVAERVNLGNGRGHYQWLRDRDDNLIALWAERL